MEDRTELLAAIDASQMTADDKALLRDVIRVTDGGGTMREVREHVGLSVGQAALLLRTNADHLRAVEGGTERDDDGPWLHPDGFAWVRRLRPQSPVTELDAAFVEMLTAAFKAAGTLDAVAAVIGTSKRTLRQWLQWLAEHRPDEYAQLPRHPPNGSAE